jgi:hypothetical protein
MKTKFFLILFFISIYGFSQSYKTTELCKAWYIVPLLYNNYISDSTRVEYWENYWYYRSSDTTKKLIPDTLIIILHPIPSMILLDYDSNTVENKNYVIKSIFRIKYGDYQNSYYVVNPRLSDEITIFEKNINLFELFNNYMESEDVQITPIAPIKVPIRKMLDSLNIYIFDRPDTNKINYYINQIIITTYFINEKGEIKCSSEFTFPINGCYSDDNCCVYEF